VENAALEILRKLGVPSEALFASVGTNDFCGDFWRLELDWIRCGADCSEIVRNDSVDREALLLHGPRWHFAGFLGGATRLL